MDTVIVSIICIVLVVFGGMTMAQGFFSSVDSSTMGWDTMEARDTAMMRTGLAAVSTTMPTASRLEFTLRNDGQTKLGDFADWDVIVQYYDDRDEYYVNWLPYTSDTPGSDQWTVKGIYQNAGSATAEVFETGILNPGEEIIIWVELDPAVGTGTTNLVVVSTSNGVSASTTFAG
ncbi:MAG: hypothetical protein WC369_01180 [Dehalococcoidales bacterium]|jgi:hypothetical protein